MEQSGNNDEICFLLHFENLSDSVCSWNVPRMYREQIETVECCSFSLEMWQQFQHFHLENFKSFQHGMPRHVLL